MLVMFDDGGRDGLGVGSRALGRCRGGILGSGADATDVAAVANLL